MEDYNAWKISGENLKPMLLENIEEIEEKLENQSLFYLTLLKSGFYDNTEVEQCLNINRKKLSELYLSYVAIVTEREDKIKLVDSAIYLNKYCRLPDLINIIQPPKSFFSFIGNEKIGRLNLNLIQVVSKVEIPQKEKDQLSIILHTRRNRNIKKSLSITP